MFDSFIDILHQNSNNLDIEYVALRLFTAVILSSIIGCERANKRHSAGLRTFILSSFSTSISNSKYLCKYAYFICIINFKYFYTK